MRYTYDTTFGMFHVRENEIPLREWSGGAARLRTLRGNIGPSKPHCSVDKGVPHTVDFRHD